MTERIELNRDERTAAVEALRGTTESSFGYGVGIALDTVIDAINRMREGDPVGTIRLAPDGTRILVRVNVNEPQYSTSYVQRWVHVNLRSGVMSRPTEDRPAPDWPVIYSPDGES